MGFCKVCCLGYNERDPLETKLVAFQSNLVIIQEQALSKIGDWANKKYLKQQEIGNWGYIEPAT